MKKWEHNIPILELFWKVLFGWKQIILWMVFFSIIAVGLGYVRDIRMYNSEMEELAVEEDVTFSEDELRQIQDAKMLQTLVDETSEYRQNSVLMNINPYQENVLTLKYYIDSEYSFNYIEENELNYTQDIINAYMEYVNDGVLAQYVLDHVNINCEVRYVEEVVRVESNGAILSIEVIYPDEDILQDISDIIKDMMNEQKEKMAENVGNHTLKLLAENIGVCVDKGLVAEQKYYQDILNSYRTQLNALKSEMSATQLNELEVEKKETENVVDIPNPSIKIFYMILGCIVGAFLAVVWIVCQILFEKHVQFEEEIEGAYGVRILGEVEGKKKHFVIDRYLLRLKNRNRKLSEEERIEVICAKIELACMNNQIDGVFLTGTVMNQVDSQIIDKIKARINSVNISIEIGHNICCNVEAFRKMASIKNVVLVEKIDKSEYKELEEELKLIAEQNGNVLGCVVVT